MVYYTGNVSSSTLSNKKSAAALETTLLQSLSNLKELVEDFDQLQIESNNYKAQYITQKERCERKVCIGSEGLKKVIQMKDNIIQLVASALTKLNETKDMNVIDEVFKILCGEAVSLTPPKENLENKILTPKKELPTSTAVNEDSLSEIDGTPTGRTSPVIHSKKLRHAISSDFREKKKCPDSWPTPERKSVKLTIPISSCSKSKSGTRLRQARLICVKQNSVVDLTSSPEFSAGSRGKDNETHVQLNIKKESFDDEDTIQPSPTSITSNFSTLYRSCAKNTPKKINKHSPCKVVKNSPSKFSKKPSLKLQLKTENSSMCNIENKFEDPDLTNMENSINLLRPNRFQTPIKTPAQSKNPEEPEIEIDNSMSLLTHIKKLEKTLPNGNQNFNSPTKHPLTENINATNLQTQCDTESSMSLLPHNKDPISNIVKKDLECIASKIKPLVKVDTLFKEPTVRKKAEKWLLPGWSCDECKNFYAELYKDNPEMLSKKMEECSKHRGRNNPARPKTPPGFWPPRWDVPEDTEEFNRRNNAV